MSKTTKLISELSTSVLRRYAGKRQADIDKKRGDAAVLSFKANRDIQKGGSSSRKAYANATESGRLTKKANRSQKYVNKALKEDCNHEHINKYSERARKYAAKLADLIKQHADLSKEEPYGSAWQSKDHARRVEDLSDELEASVHGMKRNKEARKIRDNAKADVAVNTLKGYY